jgi:hypothetical protein
MPRVIRVIESEWPRGEGRPGEDDGYRTVMRYHTLDGVLLAELDISPSFNTLVELVQLEVKPKDRERFAKAILETEPIL